MSTPSTTISLCSGVRLTPEYNHTIWFDNPLSQYEYFDSKVDHRFSGYTYLRKTWSIKVHATIEQARYWTYMFFQQGAEIWYYFITSIEYVNDNTVELFVEMDVMQSYLFDCNLLDCFVEREHAASDAIGTNVIDEGLDLGEHIVYSSSDVSLNSWYVMILATSDPFVASVQDELVPAMGTHLGNVFSGLGLYAFPLAEAENLKTVLNQLDSKGHADCIIAMWMYPEELFNKGSNSGSFMYKVDSHKSFTEPIARNAKLSGQYTPKNNKLFCYPYNFLYITNNNGECATLRYELFGDPSTCVYKIVGGLSPEGGVRLYPLNYNNAQHAYEYGLNLPAFPTCAWNSDVYKMWVAQNKHSQSLAIATGVIKAGAGVAAAAAGVSTGNLAGLSAGGGMIYSGLHDIATLMAQRADMDIQPPQAKGSYSSTVNMTAGFQTFTVQRKCVSLDYAKRLDNYFSMYGYKTMDVKKPNRNVRENWTYTKTIGCQISGDICTDDKLKIESIYNKGITFWKNGDSIGNYSLSNNCIGGE